VQGGAGAVDEGGAAGERGDDRGEIGWVRLFFDRAWEHGFQAFLRVRHFGMAVHPGVIGVWGRYPRGGGYFEGRVAGLSGP